MDTDHAVSDEQSLRLTEAAVAALRQRPALVTQVMGTLERWDRVAPAGSKHLRDRWRDILASGQWDLALARSEQGQQLRQASPLGRALTPQQRWQIVRSCKGRSSST
jgi:hypothetical protein